MSFDTTDFRPFAKSTWGHRATFRGVQGMPNGKGGQVGTVVYRSPGGRANWEIVGVTRTSTGTVLASCAIDLFETGSDLVKGRTVSGADGSFTLSNPGTGPFYLVAYKTGSPDVAGTTVQTVMPTPYVYTPPADTVTTGEVLSVTIADATPIDIASSIGARGNGWVAIVVLKGLTSLAGTVVPSALTLNVSDPGYDTAGNATTVNRTLNGVAHLRRQYPNGGSMVISTDGSDLTLYITLDDWVYSPTSIVSATIGSSFYTGAVASTSPTNTNLSTQAYQKALFSWINPQNDRSGSSYTVEAVAFHRHARAGQQVACIKFNVNDGTTTSADTLVSATSTSARISKGNIPEVWSGSVDFSGMTQGTVCNVNAKVYPWIGNSSAVLDLSTAGVSWPTTLPITKLRVLCDRTGGYGGGYAYVQVGASAGTVSATPATAAADPYPSISAALTALKAWNNTNKGHNDIGGGFIRLMDNAGANQTHTISAAGVNSPGASWCVVEKDPASGATVTVTWGASLQQYPDNMLWRNLSFLTAAAYTYQLAGYNNTRGAICFDNCSIDNTANKNLLTWFDVPYLYNLTLSGNDVDFANLANTQGAIPIAAGIVGTTALHYTNNPICWIGNSTPRSLSVASNTTDGRDGFIVYNNRVWGGVITNASATTLNYGCANVQNLYDYSGGRAGTCMNFFADGDLTTISNYVEQHNTAVGARCSRMYNDVVATKTAPNGLLKMGSSRFNIWDDYNIKSDTFSSGAGSVGNWSYMYSVGNVGNVSLYGTVQANSADAPHNDNTDTPYMGNAWLPSSEYNVKRTLSEAAIMALFTNYLVAPYATPVVGGDYGVLSTSTVLKNRVPSGLSALKKDIAGATRRTDGTGAAGAYESA